MLCECVDDPELGDRQRYGLPVPCRAEAIEIECQRAALYELRWFVVGSQSVDAPEQRCDAGEQMFERNAFGQVVVRTQSQARNDIELAFSSCQKNNRQLRRACAKLAAELEAAFDLRAEIDVDDDEIRKAVLERRQR